MNENKNIFNMKEEEIIRKYSKGANPFRTPDGYFDSFNERLMQRIAQNESEGSQAKVVSIGQRRRRRISYAAAAVVAGLCIAAGSYLWTRETASTEQMLSATAIDMNNDDYIDAALDYEMINNQQIASYLTEAY